ncbi:hypothetical protein [Halobacterium sp. CBA1126]|uniref:hypothetical protein n=1 Tax=Halobacterium TaxID=2239 RepID=UPI0012FB1C02|nr:hypothetical protein [Halobacterium sp. CBA1126]MUV60147.1 hypothetical protein [Halobacterium sp. CBA1126]
MACTNCGDGGDVEGYTVRFSQGDAEPTRMDLALCETCAEEFAAEPGIEVQ